MSDFNNGAKFMRDNIIATIIGMQNDIGNDKNSEKYIAYQEVLTTIINHHGDIFTQFPPLVNN